MEIKDVTFSYNQKTELLKSVSSEIEHGKITTIIGPNGCGKSTLLGILSRNLSPQNGEIFLDGKSVNLYKPKEFAKKLAVVHQYNEAPSDLTVEKLTGFGRIPHKRLFTSDEDEDEKAIEWALTCTNLQSKRKKRVIELSGGERQRVWISMALAQSTPILFLDEPTTYLDMYYQFEVLELIQHLNRSLGLTIVMVLHDINQAIRYSDSIIVMKQGEIVMKGNPQEIISKAMLKNIYGIDALIKYEEHAGLYVVPVGI